MTFCDRVQACRWESACDAAEGVTLQLPIPTCPFRRRDERKLAAVIEERSAALLNYSREFALVASAERACGNGSCEVKGLPTNQQMKDICSSSFEGLPTNQQIREGCNRIKPDTAGESPAHHSTRGLCDPRLFLAWQQRGVQHQMCGNTSCASSRRPPTPSGPASNGSREAECRTINVLPAGARILRHASLYHGPPSARHISAACLSCSL